jgi:hypothetical protein
MFFKRAAQIHLNIFNRGASLRIAQFSFFNGHRLRFVRKIFVPAKSKKQLEDFAKTKRKKLPGKKRSRDPDPSSKSGRDRKTSSGKSKDR